MPKPRKRDILGEAWEYTVLGDDFSTFDAEANDVLPPAGTMLWKGYSYPSVASEITPKIHEDGSSGPWWLPDDSLWTDDCRLINILRKACFMESVPVVKDELLMTCSNIAILRREQVFIPIEPSAVEETAKTNLFRSLMRKLVICDDADKDAVFTELISVLRDINISRKNAKKFNICLVKFPYRLWIEGLSHMRVHPVIVVPTEDVYTRYHH